MASMFKKPKRNFRKKQLDLEDDGICIEEPAIQANPTPQIKPPKSKSDKPKEEKKRNKHVISFELDDEEERELMLTRSRSRSILIIKY